MLGRQRASHDAAPAPPRMLTSVGGSQHTHLLARSTPDTKPPRAGLPLSPCSLAAHRVFWQGRCRTAAQCGEVQRLLRSLSHGGWPKPPHSSAPPARGAAGGYKPDSKTSPYRSPAWARSGRPPVQWCSLVRPPACLGDTCACCRRSSPLPVRPPLAEACGRGRCGGVGGGSVVSARWSGGRGCNAGCARRGAAINSYRAAER